MDDVVTAILGGGQGTRLWPLTRDRAKPAVPVGGKFRLIDVPVSNSLHGGIDRIYVLTQFNSASLHRHIAQTYRFDAFSKGFTHILAAEQTLEHRDWYQGTADAVRQNLGRLADDAPRDVLILSGDQLYRMDIEGFLARHRDSGADFTVAVHPVPPREAPGLGIMRLDGKGRIVEFVEKPRQDAVIGRLTLGEAAARAAGLETAAGRLPASMGIYLFRTEVLRELLEGSEATDFGREVIPGALADHRVMAFVHSGYWRDIGTIGAYHEASLELTEPAPALDLYSPNRPIYTHPRFLPGVQIDDCRVRHSVLCDGSLLRGERVERSVIGIRAVVRAGTTIEESVVMGAGRYENDGDGKIPLGIGRNCRIRRTIIDTDSRIGDDVRLVNDAGVEEADGDGWSIRDGIIVVHRRATIPAGTVV